MKKTTDVWKRQLMFVMNSGWLEVSVSATGEIRIDIWTAYRLRLRKYLKIKIKIYWKFEDNIGIKRLRSLYT